MAGTRYGGTKTDIENSIKKVAAISRRQSRPKY